MSPNYGDFYYVNRQNKGDSSLDNNGTVEEDQGRG
jgi:hypothetical protein